MQLRMQSDKVVEINPVWAKIYKPIELQEIIKWLYLNAIPEDVKLDEMSNLQLLELIGDDYHILCQFIEELETDLEATLKPTSKSVGKTLAQLGLETHYLGNKPIENWDNYDHGNYRGLVQKSGASLPLYGIFPNEMDSKNKYITPVMGGYHSTEWQAKSTISLLASTKQYKESEFQILPV
jgi:hypothetical protein